MSFGSGPRWGLPAEANRRDGYTYWDPKTKIIHLVRGPSQASRGGATTQCAIELLASISYGDVHFRNLADVDCLDCVAAMVAAKLIESPT